MRQLPAILLLVPLLTAAQTATTPVDTIRSTALVTLGLDATRAEAVVDRQLRLAVCTQPLLGAPRNARTAEVRCPDTPGWRLFVPVRLLANARAPVTPFVTPDPTRAAQVPTAAAVNPSTPAMAQAIATPSAFTVRRGDPVVLVARIGASEIRMAGRALGPPGPGGTVSVENTSSHRILRGHLIDEGVVEVR